MSSRRSGIALGILVVVLIAIVSLRARQGWFSSPFGERRIDDRIALLSDADWPRYEKYLDYIEMETGIDIRMLLVRNTSDQKLEEFADEHARKLNIGSANGQLRGVLLVYVAQTGEMRVELGYGMERYFPDSFVGYLLENHAAMFFNSADASLGIRLMLRIMHERIRDEMLGGTFDATAFRERPNQAYTSGGAGASAAVRSATSAQSVLQMMEQFRKPLTPERRQYYGAQPTPDAAYQRYVEWLGESSFDPAVGLLTSETQAFLRQLQLSPAYRDHILMTIYGKQHRIAQRDSVAMLYFTNTPLTSPVFLRQHADGWKIDIVAEVRYSVEMVGRPLTWSIRYASELQPFLDEFVVLDGITRVRRGDNRPLPMAIPRS